MLLIVKLTQPAPRIMEALLLLQLVAMDFIHLVSVGAPQIPMEYLTDLEQGLKL